MADPKPNILFFFTDDQRFDTIHALGNPVIQTPHLDRLAARGCVFEQAHIPGGTSGAVCMPSRAMLHSGRTLFHLEGAGESIPVGHVTLGQALRNNGYRTFGTGKWHNGHEAFNRSFSDGDEIFFGGMADHWNVPAYHYDPSGSYSQRLAEVKNPFGNNHVTWRHCDHINSGRHSSEMVCDAAIDFIGRQNGEQPFFAYVSFLAPHDPRTMPQAFLDMYDPAAIELPPNFLGGHPFDTGALRIRDEELAAFPRTPEEIRKHIAEYYGMISHLDHQLGRVMAALESQGLLENTVIVFAGDNGLAVGQHGLMGKQNCYEHSVRVPLIFAGPGIPQVRQKQALVYLLDIFPTLCALTATPLPESVEGISLLQAMHDPGQTIRDSLYFAYTDVQRAVKTPGFKLIEYAVPEREPVTQLFNLNDDPWEQNNLANRSEYTEQVAIMRAEMSHYRDQWDDRQSPWGQRFWNRHAEAAGASLRG